MGLCWLTAGLLLPYILYLLPPLGAIVLLLSGLCAVPIFRHRFGLLILLTASAWTSWHIERQRDAWQRFDNSGSQQVQGRIASLPVTRDGYLEFRLRVHDPASDLNSLYILVRWYRSWPDVLAGQTWNLQLRLKPARSRVNFSGQGREPWFFASRIAALGNVEEGPNRLLGNSGHFDLLAFRERQSLEISRVLENHPSLATISTLAIADRRHLDERDWQRFNSSGTAHLLAISGLHVGIAAGLGWWTARLLLWCMPLAVLLRGAIPLCWVFSLLTALAYASLSGFPPSTVRALVMLACIAVLASNFRIRSPWQVLLLALACVLLTDPLAPLSAGLYLSFGAVASLVWAFSGRAAHPNGWRVLLRAQAAMLLFSLPLGMFLFQRASPASFLANLVAIPWASLLVVPPVVFGTFLLPAWPDSAAFLLILAAENMELLARALDAINGVKGFGMRATHPPGAWAVGAAYAAGAILLLPRGLIRRAGALALLVPMLIKPEVSPHKMRIELLDSGQGFAAILRSGRDLMVYDSGPGDGQNWSLVPTVLEPAIHSAHGNPAHIVISHADLDHAGGLQELLDRYPDAIYHGSLPASAVPVNACHTGQEWAIGGAGVRVLHPRPGLPYLGNDSSCVLSVTFGEFQLLLTGDISRAIEQRLLSEGVHRHDILFAAHHGSNSSSSPDFITRVSPAVALVSAAGNNRYGFPHSDVRDRFEAAGAPLLSTSDCGGLRIDLEQAEPPGLSSARRLRTAPWRWPAAASCP